MALLELQINGVSRRMDVDPERSLLSVLRDDLDRIKARAIADIDEGQSSLGIAPGAHPSFDGDFATRCNRSG